MAYTQSIVLGGLGSGSGGEEGDRKLLEFLKSQKIEAVIAIPEFVQGGMGDTKEMLAKYLEELQKQGDKIQTGVKIYPGSKVHIQDQLKELWEAGAFCTLASSRYILIEFPRTGIPKYTSNIIFELQLKGLIPVIAQPETWDRIHQSARYLSSWLDKGCLVQIGVESIVGQNGRKAAKAAKLLLQSHMVHFVGIQPQKILHKIKPVQNGKIAWRPMMAKAYGRVVKWIGQDEAEEIFQDNPRLIVNNQPYIENNDRSHVLVKKKGLGQFFRVRTIGR